MLILVIATLSKYGCSSRWNDAANALRGVAHGPHQQVQGSNATALIPVELRKLMYGFYCDDFRAVP